VLMAMAPAKINLTLEVLGKRPDGFHEIRSVIQTINLCDELTFQLSQDVTIKSDSPDWIPQESLVSRAVGLLRETTGYSGGVSIEVSKRIPLVSGLGGDSSDSAATLRGLNELWGLGLSAEELVDLAAQLGSDVPFFLYGGTALAEGRGEVITPLPSLPYMWVVLEMPMIPRIPEKTKQLYDSLGEHHYTDGQITQRLVEALRAGRVFTPSFLFNAFEDVAFNRFSEVKLSRDRIIEIGATNVNLTGSGPALYTLVKDKAQAEDFYIELRQRNLTPYLTDTLAATEKVE